jgi:hypothetical protein
MRWCAENGAVFCKTLTGPKKNATIELVPHLELMTAFRTPAGDQALVGFFDAWQRSLTRLQRAQPARWRVRGLSDEEVRDALSLALFEAAREDARLIERREAAFERLTRELSALRARFRLQITPVDFREVVLAERAPSQEDRLDELQLEGVRQRAAARAEATLSRPQRQWLSAMKLAARGGGFFAASSELNLASAARVRGLHRSSAQRAYVSLQAHFSRELEREE